MKINELGDQIIKQNDLTQAKMVVAVSTGVDSTVLINALIATDQINNQQLIVAHVNHQLREQSDDEEIFLKKWCLEHQLKFVSVQWPKEQHPKNGLEAAARDFRYRFFEQIMMQNDATVLLTAHNADEQAENFIMKLIRGGWLRELGGIPKRRFFAEGLLIRPFLGISKQTLIQIAKDESLQWFEDESNQTDQFLRNRVRYEILPLFQKENDRAIEHINQLQNQINDQTALLDEIVDQKLQDLKSRYGYHLNKLRAETDAMQRQLLLKLLNLNGPDLAVGKNKLNEIIQFINETKQSQGTLDLGNTFYLELSYGEIQIKQKKDVKIEQVKRLVVTLNTWLTPNHTAKFRLSDQKKNDQNGDGQMILSENQLRFPLSIRRAQPDDRLRLKNGQFKTVRRELIDQKVPNAMRETYFAIIDANDTVLWVPGLRKAWLAAPYQENSKQFTMEFRTGGRPNGQ